MRVRGLGATGTEEGLRWSPTAWEKLSGEVKQRKLGVSQNNGKKFPFLR